jgi:sugar-phosphatase
MSRIDCAAVLFDLDGVLVDSTAYIERQWRDWALGKGLDPEPFLRYCHGRRAVETIRLAAPMLNAEAEVARFREQAVEEEIPLAALPGARELLAALPESRWAVVTSGARGFARARLAHANLPEPRVLVAAEDVREGKPSPDGYLRAAALLGVPPSACLVVEDAPAGIEAARAAGSIVVALSTTHPASALKAARLVVGSLSGVHLLASPGNGRPLSLELASAPVIPA